MGLSGRREVGVGCGAGVGWEWGGAAHVL